MEKTGVDILMCGPDLKRAKGGIVTVARHLVEYPEWNNFKLTYVQVYTPGGKVHIILNYFFALLKIVWHLLNFKTDIVYLHTAERGSFFRQALILKIAKLFKKKVILHHHAAEFDSFYDNLPHYGQNYVAKILEQADLNLVLSQSLIRMIINKAPRANVKVLYNAVSVPEQNYYDENATCILFLGELSKRKGIYDLLKIIKILDKQLGKKFKFLLCGNGNIETIMQKIKEMHIEDRIGHIGWINGQQKREILKKTVVNVLPSYNEGLPMSLLEAMSYGVPCVSTNIAAIPELITDQNGILVAPGDVEVFANEIRRLIENKNERVMFSNNSWNTINDRFNIDSQVASIKKEINFLLGIKA